MCVCECFPCIANAKRVLLTWRPEINVATTSGLLPQWTRVWRSDCHPSDLSPPV